MTTNYVRNNMKYRCKLCSYIYDKNEEVKFIDLPDDWVCPLCGVSKSCFEEVINQLRKLLLK